MRHVDHLEKVAINGEFWRANFIVAVSVVN